MRTLRRKHKKPEYGEFASLEEGLFYTHQHPMPLGDEATIEGLKSICEDDIDWDNYEIVEIEYFESGVIGADIRNKLSPFKQLIAMIKDYEDVLEHISKEKRDELIKKQLKSCEASLDYLSKLM